MAFPPINNLNLIPRTLIVDGENQRLQVPYVSHRHPHTIAYTDK